MDQTGIGRLSFVVLVGLLTVGPDAHAMVFQPTVGAGLAYTNNAALTPHNEQNDWIALGHVGANLVKQGGPLTANVSTGVDYQNYLDNTFGNNFYFQLAGTSDWTMIRDRLDWQVQDYYTQTPINSLDANTPSNTQNTNVFSLGPNIHLPLSGRQDLTVNPLFQNYYYADLDTDNKQYGVNANWLYKLTPKVQTGLAGNVTWVKYDNDNKYPAYTINSLKGELAGTGARSDYDLNLGATVINRDRYGNESGPTGSLTWTYKLTARSNARIYLASELTDSSSEYYNAQVNPGSGNYSNVQTSGDVLRSDISRFTYDSHGSALAMAFSGEYRDESYKVSPDDRRVAEVGGRVDYQVAPFVATGIYGNYNWTNATEQNQKDKTYLLGGNVSYRLSRMLRTVFDLHYQNKNSNVASVEYGEFGGLVTLVYGKFGYNSPVFPNYYREPAGLASQ